MCVFVYVRARERQYQKGKRVQYKKGSDENREKERVQTRKESLELERQGYNRERKQTWE